MNSQFIDVSISDLKSMSDDELQALLNVTSEHQGMMTIGLEAAITNEINFRVSQQNHEQVLKEIEKSGKDHWRLTPMFWIVLVTAVAAIMALYPAFFGSLQEKVHKPTAEVHQPVDQEPESDN